MQSTVPSTPDQALVVDLAESGPVGKSAALPDPVTLQLTFAL